MALMALGRVVSQRGALGVLAAHALAACAAASPVTEAEPPAALTAPAPGEYGGTYFVPVPDELEGGPNQARTHYSLGGDDGRATCRGVDGAWTCDEVLSGIEPDPRKIERTLAELPAPEARARRAVSEQFAVDPIGVLSFDARR
jgi:hypothetical protein